MKSAGILITSTQYPYYGGAATNAYALHSFFNKNGLQSALLYLGNHPPGTVYDPLKTGNVFHLTDSRSVNRRQVCDLIAAALGAAPGIVLAKNYVAPVESRTLFPDATIYYLVSGSPFLTTLAEKSISAIRYLNSPEKHPMQQAVETEAIRCSDFVVPNSPLARQVFNTLYPEIRRCGDVLNTSAVSGTSKSFSNLPGWHDRPFDIAYVCSRMSRAIKNPDLAYWLMGHSALRSCRKIVIGAESAYFKDRAYTHTLMKQDEVLSHLSQTKTLICTSYYDASPNILREAVAAGCNVVLSGNCGWSELYPQYQVCDDVYEREEWIQKIQHSLTERRPVQEHPQFGSEQVLRFIENAINYA